jgi:hypothetical protein
MMEFFYGSWLAEIFVVRKVLAVATMLAPPVVEFGVLEKSRPVVGETTSSPAKDADFGLRRSLIAEA